MNYDFYIPVKKKKVKKQVKTNNEKITLSVGQKVRYAFWANVTFEGFDDKGQVILKDKSGNVKIVSKSLFEKYVEIINEEE